MHLEKGPLLLCQFTRGEEGAKGNELVMPLRVNRVSSRMELLCTNSLTSILFFPGRYENEAVQGRGSSGF